MDVALFVLGWLSPTGVVCMTALGGFFVTTMPLILGASMLEEPWAQPKVD